jgi:hypothetical protein
MMLTGEHMQKLIGRGLKLADALEEAAVAVSVGSRAVVQIATTLSYGLQLAQRERSEPVDPSVHPIELALPVLRRHYDQARDALKLEGALSDEERGAARAIVGALGPLFASFVDVPSELSTEHQAPEAPSSTGTSTGTSTPEATSSTGTSTPEAPSSTGTSTPEAPSSTPEAPSSTRTSTGTSTPEAPSSTGKP